MGIDESLPSDPSILPSHPSDRVFAGFWAHFVDGKCVLKRSMRWLEQKITM
ncbi:unnamed protein product [Brassica oleracea var. botrytis]